METYAQTLLILRELISFISLLICVFYFLEDVKIRGFFYQLGLIAACFSTDVPIELDPVFICFITPFRHVMRHFAVPLTWSEQSIVIIKNCLSNYTRQYLYRLGVSNLPSSKTPVKKPMILA